MISIYLPIPNSDKSLTYHYQTEDSFISDLLALGTFFRTLPCFPQIYISGKNKSITQLQSILKNPPQIITGKPKNKNFHTISISPQINNKADLTSLTSFNQSPAKASIISITGNGKGKTTIGLGFLLFNLLKRAQITSYHFFKDKDFSNGVSEFNFPDLIKPNLVMHTQNSGFLLPDASKKEFEKHQKSALKFLSQIKKDITSQKFNLIFLDEIIDALIADLINQSQLKELITLARQNNTKLILTGRYTKSEKFNIKNLFDSNIVVKKIKHPYDSGIKAIKGLDY